MGVRWLESQGNALVLTHASQPADDGFTSIRHFQSSILKCPDRVRSELATLPVERLAYVVRLVLIVQGGIVGCVESLPWPAGLVHSTLKFSAVFGTTFNESLRGERRGFRGAAQGQRSAEAEVWCSRALGACVGVTESRPLGQHR